MTLDEASGRFCINMEKLKYYEDNGLLECRQVVDGIPDYTEQELKKVGLLYSLQKAGLDLAAVKRYLFLADEGTGHKEERIRILRKRRCQLLEEIHSKQQSLDELDYMIHEIRKEGF